MPSSRAARIVSIDSVSSLPPHIQPPMAQVPIAMRETSSEVPGTLANGMLRSRYFGLLPTIQLLLSSAMVSNADYPLIAAPARTVSGAIRGESRRVKRNKRAVRRISRRAAGESDPLAMGYGEVMKGGGVSTVPEAWTG